MVSHSNVWKFCELHYLIFELGYLVYNLASWIIHHERIHVLPMFQMRDALHLVMFTLENQNYNPV